MHALSIAYTERQQDFDSSMHKKTHLQTCDELDAALSNYRGEDRFSQ
jgi:hypothetical protein